MSNIDDICRVYLEAATNYVEAREAYRKAFAFAFSTSSGKTEALKKADADQLTSEARLKRDKCELVAAVEWQRLLAARGPMTDSIQPLQKFGDT